VAKGEPLCLAVPGTAATPLSIRNASDSASVSDSLALAVCALLESWPEGSTNIQPGMEWDIAPAHAVLGAAGARIWDPESELEFAYNKDDLSTKRGIVCRQPTVSLRCP
jgi:3'-phosphoadenosine 5'-phosphosulfate (PAPS) 3'-phosphatase